MRRASKKDEGDSDAEMDMNHYHYKVGLCAALVSSAAAKDKSIWPGLPEGFRGRYNLSGVVTHKLVKGRRLKVGSRALDGVGRVEAVNNGHRVALWGGLGSVTAGIALVAISLTMTRPDRAWSWTS